MDSGRSPSPWWPERIKRGFLRFWRAENPKLAILRDIAVAGLAVAVLLGAAWTYTGQPFPSGTPIVVVESGSMMHGPYRSGAVHETTGWSNPSFGRVGTVDPGDLVFLKDVDSPQDVVTAFQPDGRSGYGGHGDIVVFNSFGGGQFGSTQIIHRAMLWVEETSGDGCMPNIDCVFRIPAACDPGFADFVVSGNLGAYCAGSPDTITGRLERDGLRLSLNSYPCAAGSCPEFFNSFITMGDNNLVSDQKADDGACYVPSPGCNSAPVQFDWIVGKGRGELPWVGLIKLMLYGNERYLPTTDPTLGANWKILAATAPWDIWLSFFIVVGLVVMVPVTFDFVMGRLAERKTTQSAPPEPPNEPDRPAK